MRNPEHIQYGYRLNISREDAGYRSKPSPEKQGEQEEPNFVYKFIQQILSKLIDEESLNNDAEFQYRSPKGDPDSYDIYN